MNQNANNNKMLPPEVKGAFMQEDESLHDEMERVWDLLESSSLSGTASGASNDHTQSTEKTEMWQALQQKIQSGAGDRASASLQERAPDRSSVRNSKLRLVTRTRIYALAASFALLIAAGYFYWNTPVTVTALPGEFTSVMLPDGSSVELNSGTSLQYHRNFGALPFASPAARDVQLTGEAFFDVAHAGTGFTVSTFNARVNVLGTTFNVRARPEDTEATEVTLSSGRVEVFSSNHSDQRTLLTREGDHVTVTASLPAPEQPVQKDTGSLLIWRDSGFSANGEPLSAVFSELERRFDVQITTENSAIAADSLSIIMPRPGSIETILDDICTYKELQYRKTSRGYEIY